MDDLANYEVKVMEPVTGTYRGYKIISSPLPSSGGTHVIEALNIMENFDIASMGFDSAEKLHIPLSSMSPTVVLKEDGSPFMVLGSPGATKIITTVTQIISNVIDFDMSMQEAIDAPRLYNNATSAIQYETRLNADSIKKLEELGNTVEPNDEFNRSFGSVNAVMYGEDGTLLGGADPRRDGKALGY